MTTLREAAEQALEALEDMLGWESLTPQSVQDSSKQSVQRLREALAQPEQEPVAWMIYTLDGASVCVTDSPSDFTSEYRSLPLYATPHQRKPLTDEEILLVLRNIDPETKRLSPGFKAFAQEIEAAHNIGEKG